MQFPRNEVLSHSVAAGMRAAQSDCINEKWRRRIVQLGSRPWPGMHDFGPLPARTTRASGYTK
eukprot:13910616-Alexandrium_andersonii.AAC.1